MKDVAKNVEPNPIEQNWYNMAQLNHSSSLQLHPPTCMPNTTGSLYTFRSFSFVASFW
jgi:hypothetical protein